MIGVRPVMLGDLPALRNLFLRSRQESFTWEHFSSRLMEDFDSQTEGELQIVALDGDRLVGFISVWEPDDVIHHLHVDPGFLRRGVGRALLRALPGWPVTRYRLKCLTCNVPALAFYRDSRFVQVGEGRVGDQDYLLLESIGDCSY